MDVVRIESDVPAMVTNQGTAVAVPVMRILPQAAPSGIRFTGHELPSGFGPDPGFERRLRERGLVLLVRAADLRIGSH